MELIERPLYTEKLMSYLGSREVKVLTGIRSVGKSSILNLFQQRLLNRDISADKIIYIDFEQTKFAFITDSVKFYEYITDIIKPKEQYYLILDEIYRVKDWQQVVIALKLDFNVDIYLSSSGRNIIDDDFRRQLEHKLIEIEVLPLSFKEYQTFTALNESQDIDKSFDDYISLGALPITSIHSKNVFYSIMAQDVFIPNKIADNSLIMLLIKILCSEMGKVHSFNSIGKILSGFVDKAPAVRTIENYINMLLKARIFYCVPVFDFKNAHSLTRYAKYYPVDLGFYHILSNKSDKYNTYILESIIYFELMRLGVKVSTCKVGNKKVAFLAESEDNKIYIHATTSLTNNDDRHNEKEIFAPLRAISDHYSKWVLTLDKGSSHSGDGIRVSNIVDFLLEE